MPMAGLDIDPGCGLCAGCNRAWLRRTRLVVADVRDRVVARLPVLRISCLGLRRSRAKRARWRSAQHAQPCYGRAGVFDLAAITLLFGTLVDNGVGPAAFNAVVAVTLRKQAESPCCRSLSRVSDQYGDWLGPRRVAEDILKRLERG